MQPKKPKGSLLEIDVSLGGVSLTQKALFAKHLSVMLKAGLTITEALETTQESTKGKFKKVLAEVLHSVQAGRNLSDSFANYPKVFSGLFVNVTKAGESSGTLVENFENIALQLEKERDLVNKIKGALLYPMVVLVAAFFLGMGVSFLVLPKIVPLFEGLRVELPITTRALIAFSHLVQERGILLFFGIIASVAGIVWVVRQKFSRPVTNWITLHVPPFKKHYQKRKSCSFFKNSGNILKILNKRAR